MLMPLSGSTSPMAALCLGEMEKSAHFASHTVLVSNQTSVISVSEYLRVHMAGFVSAVDSVHSPNNDGSKLF